MNESSTQVVRPDSSSHWYKVSDSGIESFHHVPYAGKRGAAGETRRTTLGDARKIGAFPSVTNVLGILHKDFLEAYKINQAILAALTLPRIQGESEDDFARRVVADSKEHAASAARLGSRLHEVGAALLVGGTDGLPLEGEIVEGRNLAEVAEPLEVLFKIINPTGLKTDAEFSEFYVSHPMGYAGTCDGFLWLDPSSPTIASKLIEAGYVGCIDSARSPIVAMGDIKSRGANSKSAPIYETDLLQLSAYLHAIPTTPNLGFNVNIHNTPVANILVNTHPNAGKDGVWEAEIVIHKREDIEKAWVAFQNLFQVWCWLKGYNPASK